MRQQDFAKELQDRIKRIDEELDPKKMQADRDERDKRVEEEQKKTNQVFGELYSIHKRRLVRDADPVKQLDQRILWNLPANEIGWWMDKLKTKLIDEEKGIVEYYEKVRQDGKFAGVLDNEYAGSAVVKPEGSDDIVEVLKGESKYDSQITEPDWKG